MTEKCSFTSRIDWAARAACHYRRLCVKCQGLALVVVATALPNTCSLQNWLAGSLGSSTAAAASLVRGSCLTDQVSLAHRGFISQCDYPVTFIAHDDLCSFCVYCLVHAQNSIVFFIKSYISWWHTLACYSAFLLRVLLRVNILFCGSRMTKRESKSNITNI